MTGVSLSGDTGAPTQGQGATTPATQTGNPTTGVTTEGSTGSPAAAAQGGNDWLSSIQDAGLKEMAVKKGWDKGGVESALKSYKELETAFSQKTANYSAPEKAEDYKFEAPKLPDGMSYDNNFSEAMKKISHTAKLSQEQFKAVHDGYIAYATEQFGAGKASFEAQLTERVTQAQTDLENTFKAKAGTPVFNRNVEMAKRAIRMVDPALTDALRDVGAITKVNGQDMVTNAKLFAAFSKIGTDFYAEDSLYGKPAEDTNPFDPKTQDIDKQGWWVRNDPEKARMLIRAAGPEVSARYRAFLDRK